MSKIKPAFTKYGAKHTQGSSIKILLPSMCEMKSFFLMIQVPANSMTEEYIVYFVVFAY